MNRAVLFILFSALPMVSGEQLADDIPAKTRAALKALKVGMREADVVALLRPVSLESGRITYGGTGAGRVYFRVSETQQLWVEIDATKGFLVSRFGPPEPLGVWTHDYYAGLIVLSPKAKSK